MVKTASGGTSHLVLVKLPCPDTIPVTVAVTINSSDHEHLQRTKGTTEIENHEEKNASGEVRNICETAGWN